MAHKILVVDDDAGIRDALRMILDYEGYEVLSASDGKAALAELDSTRIDAVLLDIKMPGMDGFEILDRIVAREDAPPVLMISGHGDIATAVVATRRR
ncbi:MAG TPA: response regulator, partial [Thermoanaerobaculia bacterium]|nr:response regulator [Thermoanaerobaculia bacterium]